MKIDIAWLIKKNACTAGINWFLVCEERDVEMICKQLMAESKFVWANWLLSRALDRDNKIRYAIYAARKVLHIFEEKYPKDNRPRKAIEDSEFCLKGRLPRQAATYAANVAVSAYEMADADAAANYTINNIAEVAYSAYATAKTAAAVSATECASYAYIAVDSAVHVADNPRILTLGAPTFYIFWDDFIDYGLQLLKQQGEQND
jgi:hypothetical protein